MLVSRLPDRRALSRLVRAAVRNEVAQVVLSSNGPQRAEAMLCYLTRHADERSYELFWERMRAEALPAVV